MFTLRAAVSYSFLTSALGAGQSVGCLQLPLSLSPKKGLRDSWNRMLGLDILEENSSTSWVQDPHSLNSPCYNLAKLTEPF